MDTPAIINIEQATTSYLNEKGIYSQENLDRFNQIIIEGYTQLSIDHVYRINVATPYVSEGNIVKFPRDMVDYYLVGLVRNGEIFTLTRNDDIAIPFNESCGFEMGNPDLLNPISEPIYRFTNKGVWNFGKYKIDIKRRLIIFEGSMVGQQVYIEYITSGVSLTEKTWINIRLLPVLKAYLHWIITERDDRAALSSKQRAMALYDKAVLLFSEQDNGFTLYEAMDAIRSGYTMGVKL